MNNADVAPNQIFSCVDVFLRINNLSSSNFKYVKTQFYNKIYANASHSSTLVSASRSTLRNLKHKYEKVSTLVSCQHMPRFQQKGLIVIWPQRKKFCNKRKLMLLTWFLSHAMYFLCIINMFPMTNIAGIKRPPWNFKQKFSRPLKKDYIIEPDWDSQYMSESKI